MFNSLLLRIAWNLKAVYVTVEENVGLKEHGFLQWLFPLESPGAGVEPCGLLVFFVLWTSLSYRLSDVL